MKRTLACLLTLCLAACGCGTAAEPEPVPPSPPGAPAVPSDNLPPPPTPEPAPEPVAEPAPEPAPAPAPAAEEPASAADAGEKPIGKMELRKLLAEWCEAQKKLKTIVTGFTCTETSPMLVRPQVTKGLIQIKKPDGYRRSVFADDAGKEELAGLMILKPPKLWVYLPAAKRAEEFDLAKVAARAGSNPLKSLGDIISFDEERISKSFTIFAFRLEDGGCRLEYVPLEGKAIGGVGKVRVWLKPGARFMDRMETATGNGDLRTEEYSDTKFDEELSDELFAFKKPRGVELIKVVP